VVKLVELSNIPMIVGEKNVSSGGTDLTSSEAEEGAVNLVGAT
jgi:hypothetical protein